MAPERSPKRQKTSSGNDTAAQSRQEPLPPKPSNLTLRDTADPTGKQQPRASWYSTWSRTTAPLTQIAQDRLKSVSDTASDVASEVAATVKDVSTKPKSIRSPSLAMTLGKGQSSRTSLAGSPADATTTMVHAEVKSPGRNSKSSIASTSEDNLGAKDPLMNAETMRTKSTSTGAQGVAKPEEVSTDKGSLNKENQQEVQTHRTGWLNWLAKGDGAGTGDHTETPQPEPEPMNTQIADTSKQQGEKATRPATTSTDNPLPENRVNRKSWLPLWNGDSAYTSNIVNQDSKVPKQVGASVTLSHEIDQTNLSATSVDPETGRPKPAITILEASPPPKLPQDTNKATGWAFWSRDRTGNDSSTSVDKPRDGEIAVSDTPSQNRPRKTSIAMPETKNEQKMELKKPLPTQLESKNLNGTETTTETASKTKLDDSSTKTHKRQASKSEGKIASAESSNASAVAVEPAEAKRPTSLKAGKTEHNLLLPSLSATLKLPGIPSLLLRLANLLYMTKEPQLRHLSLVKDPPQVKIALAIGVHGYFPAPLIRSVLGQPTGTSIKFADMAAKSIKRWTASRGYDCEVKTAALEGEGKIAERIELLWKLLLNWIEEIRKSDFIVVACHSQGVPVAIMLVAKLIQFGCVNSARVCICAMAGVSMGPFPEYKSRWIGGSAGELFEFSDPSSRVSADYLAALDIALKFGVRLTFIGSIDDQLVSLESSIFSPVFHPNIFRAVSIDSRVHAPNFLSHLVGFALKLRNLGVQDHGLIRELSSPLAGSLYTGEGHSRIYEDDAVYDLAVAFALETTTLTDVHLSQRTAVSVGSNPYILPFAMRGILEEDFVKNELQGEAADLLKEFDEWKPNSKALKDVKFRLEGIRSRL